MNAPLADSDEDGPCANAHVFGFANEMLFYTHLWIQGHSKCQNKTTPPLNLDPPSLTSSIL